MSHDPLARYWNWCGLWGGTGSAQDGRPVAIRMVVQRRLLDSTLGMHFEATSPDGAVLYHGVITAIGPTPTGQVRAATFSTIHGSMVLDQTPDDEGVLALAGQSLRGNQINVTIAEENPQHLMFTALWRPPGAMADDPRLGRMASPLTRLAPMRIPSGPPPGKP